MNQWLALGISCWLGLPMVAFGQDAGIRSGDVEIANSRVYVFVGKTGLGHEHGAIGKLKTGTLHLSSPEPQHSLGTLVFDMASFDADGDVARKYVGLEGSTDASTRSQVNANLLGKDVLNVRAYPTATFEAKQIEKLLSISNRGLAQYKFSGQFTLHGTTRPLEFIADLEIVKGWQHLRGEFEILQSDYGIKPFSKMFGTIGVSDKIKIYGDLYVAP